MIYLVDDLIKDFRSDVYDRADVDDNGCSRDTLWSDEDILRYANSAAQQWAADTLAYRRHFTLALEPDRAVYAAPYDLIEIVRANYTFAAGQRGRLLTVFNLDEGALKDDYGTYFLTSFDLENAKGVPRGITRDDDPSMLRIYPAPSVVSVPGPTKVDIHAVVYPEKLFCGMPVPSSNEQDKHLIMCWMKKLAYAKQDADVLDLDRSLAFESEYRDMARTRKIENDRNVRAGGIIQSSW